MKQPPKRCAINPVHCCAIFCALPQRLPSKSNFEDRHDESSHHRAQKHTPRRRFPARGQSEDLRLPHGKCLSTSDLTQAENTHLREHFHRKCTHPTRPQTRLSRAEDCQKSDALVREADSTRGKIREKTRKTHSTQHWRKRSAPNLCVIFRAAAARAAGLYCSPRARGGGAAACETFGRYA